MQLVKQWAEAGQNGKALDVPFSDQQNLQVVQQQWGSSPQGTYVGAGTYFSYPNHAAAFGVNKGMQMFDVRSYSTSVQGITRADVTAAIGQPDAVRYAAGTTIYLYTDGPDYQLLWVFPGGPGQTGSNVSHVDVFWPQGTIDQMAQDVPNPGVDVTPRPGSKGSYFGFSITNPPPGYYLAELEWLPVTGSPVVVNTPSQAATNAQQQTPGTFWAQSQGSYQFQYLASQQGSSGRVRLIYQDPAGRAIIGTSNTITLTK